MNDVISPRYQMKLVKEVAIAIWAEYATYANVEHYIEKWHISYGPFGNDQNFYISRKANQSIDLENTLHSMDGEILLKIAIEMGVDTPDFIPSIPTFRNAIKSEYVTASATFEEAFRQIETHPDIAVGLVNSALESIIKEIFKDDRIQTKPKAGKTLYDLTSDLLKEFKMYPGSDIPSEIRTIGSSLLSANQGIEKLRSEKTNLHGKTKDDYIIEDSIYPYFVVNSVTTVGLFLNSYCKKKFPPVVNASISDGNDLPF
jgi:hypothetical protein